MTISWVIVSCVLQPDLGCLSYTDILSSQTENGHAVSKKWVKTQTEICFHIRYAGWQTNMEKKSHHYATKCDVMKDLKIMQSCLKFALLFQGSMYTVRSTLAIPF